MRAEDPKRAYKLEFFENSKSSHLFEVYSAKRSARLQVIT
jgi:hypothetical protein